MLVSYQTLVARFGQIESQAAIPAGPSYVRQVLESPGDGFYSASDVLSAGRVPHRFHDFPQPVYRTLDGIGPGDGVQADKVGELVGGREEVAGCDGDVALEGQLVQLEGVDVFRQLQPQHGAAGCLQIGY